MSAFSIVLYVLLRTLSLLQFYTTTPVEGDTCVDFKFFKEEDVDEPPSEMIEWEAFRGRKFWNNRLIRCKHVKNWCDDTINEFKEFVSKVDGLEVEIVEPFIKARLRVKTQGQNL